MFQGTSLRLLLLCLIETETLYTVSSFISMGYPRPLFRFIFGLGQKNITNFYNNQCEEMSIQYMVLGFEPTTFRS